MNLPLQHALEALGGESPVKSFHFQLRRRGELRHSMTCDCSDRHDAWAHALATCSDFLRGTSGIDFQPGDGWILEVTTSAGEHCWRLLFSTSGVDLAKDLGA